MVFVVMLAILAFALIKSLMSVVARDEAATAAPWSPESSTDPTVELHATVNDDVRAFLLSAAPERTEAQREQAAFEQSLFDEIAANESSRSR